VWRYTITAPTFKMPPQVVENLLWLCSNPHCTGEPPHQLLYSRDSSTHQLEAVVSHGSSSS